MVSLKEPKERFGLGIFATEMNIADKNGSWMNQRKINGILRWARLFRLSRCWFHAVFHNWNVKFVLRLAFE